jgi:hypothetical protein
VGSMAMTASGIEGVNPTDIANWREYSGVWKVLSTYGTRSLGAIDVGGNCWWPNGTSTWPALAPPTTWSPGVIRLLCQPKSAHMTLGHLRLQLLVTSPLLPLSKGEGAACGDVSHSVRWTHLVWGDLALVSTTA